MNPTQPRRGGTLRLYGPADLDRLDPACSSQSPAYQITRLFARQLFTYPAEADLRDWRAIAPVPDLATFVPSTYNTGMGATHRNYVVHLRPGAYWDTTPPRRVTAQDVVRGLKRMCNPVIRPAALPYFTSTIRGMAGFCEEYAASVTARDPDPAELAAFQDSHEIPGVFVLDEESLVIEVTRPAIDLIDILALPCASPAPVEYDAFIPDSPELRANLRSNGPYRVTSHVPGRELRLEPNPAWRQDADPVRRQHLDAVEVVMDRVSPARIAAEIGAGRADLPWGSLPAEPYEDGTGEPDHGLGHALDPYLVFNTHTMSNPLVRRSIAYAIDKAAVAEVYRELRTGTLTRLAGSVVPPGNDAHQDLDPYATPGGRGDPEGARDLLAAAGHADGLTLTLVHLDAEAGHGVAQACAAALGKAGITVRPLALDPAAYYRLLRDPARAAAGEWDVAVAARTPDWCHANGRVFLQAMFQTNPSPGTANYGQYSEPAVNELIDQALAAVEEPGRALEAWHAAERRVLEDAAVVPILFQTPCAPRLRGARVRDAIPMPAAGHAFDLSAVWLAG